MSPGSDGSWRASALQTSPNGFVDGLKRAPCRAARGLDTACEMRDTVRMQTKHEERLGTEPIGRLMLSLALPAILAQFVNILYNMVDRMYIGRIPGSGALALTGLGLCFPIITAVSAFSAFVCAGGAPLAAIALGEGDRDRAEKFLGNGVTLLLIFSAVLTVALLMFKRPLLMAFGASENTIGYADEYLTVYLVGTVFVQLSLGLNMFISCQGQARVAMASVIVGAVANIVLDPLFIFALGMGVRGAALATILSQALSAAWIVRFLTSDRSALRIRRRHLAPVGKIVGPMMALGVSPFIMQITESLISVVFNTGLQRYGGDMHVGAMTILQSVMQLKVVPLSGFTQGVQPIISYNYGAKQYQRVRLAIKRMAMVTIPASFVISLLAMLLPTVFASLFTDDAALIALVGQTLPIYMAGMLIFGVQNCAQATFVALGQARVSLFIALLRKVILLVPLALILPAVTGSVMGIYWAEPIADVVSALTAGTLLLVYSKKLLPE